MCRSLQRSPGLGSEHWPHKAHIEVPDRQTPVGLVWLAVAVGHPSCLHDPKTDWRGQLQLLEWTRPCHSSQVNRLVQRRLLCPQEVEAHGGEVLRGDHNLF